MKFKKIPQVFQNSVDIVFIKHSMPHKLPIFYRKLFIFEGISIFTFFDDQKRSPSSRYNGDMKRIFLSFFAALLLVGLITDFAQSDAQKPQQTTMVPATQQGVEGQYLQFKKVFPMMPGSLNLFGYETTKAATGIPILSPDRTQMAVTEVFFMPENEQTLSRVFLLPVGHTPALADLLPPTQMMQDEDQSKETQKTPHAIPPSPPMNDSKAGDQAGKTQKSTNSLPQTPVVDISQIDPHAFWLAYEPQKQMRYRKTIFEAGFDANEPGRFDGIQVVDWSADGQKILMVYRPGFEHMGIWQTIPVIYDLAQQKAVRLTMLPNEIWYRFLKRYPEQHHPKNRVWDVRVLGWSATDPQEFIVKLVIFEGQSELPAGFWSDNIQTGAIHYLGSTISEGLIARNGWLVSFVDPTAPGGPHTYAPGEIPPETQENRSASPNRSWFSRLQFWKK